MYSAYEDEDVDEDGLDFLSFVKPRPQLPHHWRSSPPPAAPRKVNKILKNRSHASLRSYFSLPASPDTVLARENYNYSRESRDQRTTSPSSYKPPQPRLTKVLTKSRSFMRIRRPSNCSQQWERRPSVESRWAQSDSDKEDSQWVRVDLEWMPQITQHELVVV